MQDTIELLEAIGSDASLRHATGEDLARALAGLNASESLKQAMTHGDRRVLERELGYSCLPATQTPTQTGFEEDFEGEGAPEPDTDREERLPV